METNNILIVEDDKEIREGVQIYLQSQGYKVFQAADGIEGLEVIEKEDIHLELKDGYLTITATTGSNKEEKQQNGTYIRRERYAGTCSRSFYVGDDMKQEDIKAKFENGVLSITVPKKEEKPVVENNSYITIEG